MSIKQDFGEVNKWSLTKLGACEDGKRWFLRNIGKLPVENIEKIEGDYNNYISWLKEKFMFTKYDEKGNQIHYEDSDGFWKKFKYDSNGNMVYYKDLYGFWKKIKYDEKGNQIHYEDSNGKKWKREYINDGEYFTQYLNGKVEVKIPLK